MKSEPLKTFTYLSLVQAPPNQQLPRPLTLLSRAVFSPTRVVLHHHRRHHPATISSTISSGQNSNGQPPRKLLNPRGERTNKGVRAFASFNMEPKSDASGGPEFTECLHRLLFGLASRSADRTLGYLSITVNGQCPRCRPVCCNCRSPVETGSQIAFHINRCMLPSPLVQDVK